MEANKKNNLTIPEDFLIGKNVSLRLLEIKDCTDRYSSWLNNNKINRFLETRWEEQNIDTIKAFVFSMQESENNYLFAIHENQSNLHVGNIKLGPINFRHLYADISYFIGEENSWGKGFASEAIKLIVNIGFSVFKLHRIQAGLYATNIGSAKALLNAGFNLESISYKQLKNINNEWEDHHWYVKFNE